MEANELRIGNRVVIPEIIEKFNSGENCLIQSGGEIEITIKNFCGIFQQHDNLEPNPLTEEWLLKFGFKEDGYLHYLIINKDISFVYSLKNTDIILDIQNSQDGLDHNGHETFQLTNFHIMNSQYVHQLQNLYFTLTGKELTIK